LVRRDSALLPCLADPCLADPCLVLAQSHRFQLRPVLLEGLVALRLYVSLDVNRIADKIRTFSYPLERGWTRYLDDSFGWT